MVKMTDEARLKKNLTIKMRDKATRTRRFRMSCHVYDLKIQSNKLSTRQAEEMTRLFLEAKWLRNEALASENPYKFNTSIGTVHVKLPDGSLDERKLHIIGSQIKQDIGVEIRTNIQALAKRKKSRKVGRLRFCKRKTSINLRQFGLTYKLNFETSRVKIQGIHKWLRVNGLNQIKGLDIANAKLVDKPDGYHLMVTCFEPKKQTFQPGTEIGLDMGVRTSITLSDGRKINAVVEETGLRPLRKKLSRQHKGSNSYKRTLHRINKMEVRLGNRRDNLANQVVHDLLKYEHVYMQDGQISSWRRRDSLARGSHAVQYGILGRVKAKFITSPQVSVLNRWVATTAWCSECGERTKHSLDKRIFVCSNCGASEDRDVHAALNMIAMTKAGYPLKTSIGSGTLPKSGGANVRLSETLSNQSRTKQSAVKPEAAQSLAER